MRVGGRSNRLPRAGLGVTALTTENALRVTLGITAKEVKLSQSRSPSPIGYHTSSLHQRYSSTDATGGHLSHRTFPSPVASSLPPWATNVLLCKTSKIAELTTQRHVQQAFPAGTLSSPPLRGSFILETQCIVVQTANSRPGTGMSKFGIQKLAEYSLQAKLKSTQINTN